MLSWLIFLPLTGAPGRRPAATREGRCCPLGGPRSQAADARPGRPRVSGVRCDVRARCSSPSGAPGCQRWGSVTPSAWTGSRCCWSGSSPSSSPIALLGSWTAITERVKAFTIAMLGLETGGARDVPEPRPDPLLRLLGSGVDPHGLPHRPLGRAQQAYAAIKFFLYTMAASVLMLMAIIALHVTWHRPAGRAHLRPASSLAHGAAGRYAGAWLFAAFALAFAVKVPIWPLHTWLPDAHTEAPDGRQRDPGRHLVEDGDLRIHPVRAVLFPHALVGLRR